ncbi:MAG: YraN family protein [Methylophaga sp.]|nr:MAG: YraN family protein [Methylophaga sp.]
MNNLGEQAEELANQYLQKHKLTLISQNYQCRRGEIDLIMQDQHTLVFVEVRYRKNARFGSALESVDHKKQAKIITTAEHYLLQSKQDYFDYRFDVIAIMPMQNSEQPEITWIKDAFQLN